VIEASHHVEIFKPREVLVHGRILTAHANHAANLFGVFQHIDPVDVSKTRIGLGQCGENFHRRRLARPIGTQHRLNGSSGDAQRQIIKGAHSFFSRLIRLGEVLCFNKCTTHESPSFALTGLDNRSPRSWGVRESPWWRG